LNYSLVRPAEVYGTKNGEGIDLILKIALLTRTVLDFRSNGSVTYAPVSADEVAGFLVKAALKPAGKKVYTLCASEPWDARKLCREFTIVRRRSHVVLPIPIRTLELALKVKLPVPFESDQIARLLVPKSDDLTAAKKDYDFNPLPFGDYIRKISKN
jgi:uncharacterized protein YbjT (DUF2867 family)